ncbi:MAG: PH domain-containing protein [Paludibacter sp.]|nr:PH domain-containing protein [Paludibacter sp.]
MTNQKKVFRSRVSILLTTLTLAIYTLVSIPVIQDMTHIGIFVLGGTLFLLIFLFTGMRYIISGNKLYIKIWFIRTLSVNITDILWVRRSYNPLSSAAASLKRLRISLNKNAKYPFILISPAREQQFLEELKAINPNIVFNVPGKTGLLPVWDWDI